MRPVGIILLAAGGSVRMGSPKQLLPFRGTTLLRHAAATALETALGPVVVVLGAEAEACTAELGALAVTPVVNPGWQGGMGTSLRAGIEALEKISPGVQAVLVLLHDQPLIAVPALHRLVACWNPPQHRIAAAFYGGKLGVPAIFDRSLFPELKILDGAEGAKKILARHASEVAAVDLPEALEDLDSPEDYQRLTSLEPPPAP